MMNMQKRLNEVFDDLIGSDARHGISDMDKLIMVVEELAVQLEKKADEDHGHTLT